MATPSKEFTAALEQSKAEYVNLGKSGLRVSVPILGAMSFGSRETLPWVIEEDEVRFFPSRLQLKTHSHF